MFTIRQANLDDLDTLVELRVAMLREASFLTSDRDAAAAGEAIRQFFTKKMPEGEFLAWVAEAEGCIVGTSGLVFL
jgi:hypothetical protein